MTVRFQAFHSIKAIGQREVLFNWSRTNPLGALEQVWRPKNRDELQQLLRENPERKLRLIGSGLSFEPIHSVYAEGSQALLVDLHHLRGQLAQTADTVTYQAGTPLDTVYADLIAMERMLPVSPGVIGIQTLGGALSTGTHGQGLHQSALCDAVAALTVMLASGDIIRVDRTDPRFGAFVMGMGMLGILLDVTLNTVPNRIMRCTKFTTDYPFLLAHNERLNREHAFVKSWWFAWTGESHIWLVDPASEEEVARYRAGGSEPLLLEGDIDARMNATIDATLQKMAKDTKDEALAGEHFETVRRFKDASDLVGNVYHILCKGIPAPQINCEVAVPLHRMNEALETLQAWQQAKSQGDIGKLMSFYAADFTSYGIDLNQWRSTLQREVRQLNGRSLQLKELSYLHWHSDASEDTMVVTFGEVAQGTRSGPIKRQYWLRQGGQWKIFFEGVIG